jgi:sugar diacid utilization regulator
MNGILAIEVDSRTTILVASILDARKQPSNYILVVGKPGTSSDQGKLMLLSIAIRMFSVIQSHKRTLGHIETLSRDSYVSDLLTGRVKSAEVIIERGRLVGLNMQNKRRALVLTWKNPWPGLNGIYKSLSAQPENVCFRGHSRLVVMREPCLTTEDDDYRLRQELTRIWTSSGKPGWDVGFAIGIGLIQPGVEFLFRSHMEACNALRLHSILAGRLGYCDDPPLVFHDTVGYLAMIERLASDPMHRAAAHALLTPLLESDQQHGGHLLRTMLVHLWEGCNIRRTASRLFVHRNTLSYRLRKISELLGEDPFGRTNMPKYLLAVGIEVFPQEPPAPDSTESAVPVAL